MTRVKLLFLVFLLPAVLSTTAIAQKQPPPEGGQPKDFELPAKETFTLDNGMRVTMVPFGTLPKLLARVVMRVGNLNESADEVWLADMTAEMLKEGTSTRDAQTIATEAASMGGSVEVSVGTDQSWVGGDVLSEFSPDLVRLLADIVRHPSFPEAEFMRLRKDMIRDLSIAKTRARNLAREKFRQVLYSDHPYGRPYPTEEMLENYTLDDVRNFYETNFGALRTHLYVVGKFDTKAVEMAVRKAFGGWTDGAEPLIKIPSPVSERKVYLVDRQDAPQTTIYFGLPVIDPTQKNYSALEVTNTLLGGYFSSRITANLREDKGYTYSPRSSLSTRFRDTYWVEVADVNTEATGASLKEITYEIDRLQAEPVSEEELTGVQNYMAGNFVLQNSSRSGIVGQLVYMDLHGLSDEYLNNYVKIIYSVTPADVQRMANEILEDENMTIVLVGDVKTIRRQVEPYGEVVDEVTNDE